MTYVITQPCIGVKDASCVDVCPVDCIHPSQNELMSVLTVARANPHVPLLLFLRNLPPPNNGNTLSKLTPISSKANSLALYK